MKAQPANSNDTICVFVSTYQKLVISAKQKTILQQQLSTLNQRIAQKDSIITLLQSQDTTNHSIITTYQNEIKTMKDQRTILENSISYAENLLKKERRRKKLSMFGGIAGIGILTFLYLTK